MLKRKLAQGFTLVELMITVVIIAVLATIAVPSYTNYVKTGNAQEAPSNLLALKTQAEQYYADNPAKGYKDFPCATPASATMFAYTCAYTPVTVPQDTITITATGITGKNIAGWTYTIDQSGARTSSGIDGAASSTCWITRSNGSC